MDERTNVQHGQRRGRPLSWKIPMALIVLELAMLVAVVIFVVPLFIRW